MSNCVWEYVVTWNRDPEVTYALKQAIVYLRAVENASLQHGNVTNDFQLDIQASLRANFCPC